MHIEVYTEPKCFDDVSADKARHIDLENKSFENKKGIFRDWETTDEAACAEVNTGTETEGM